MKELLLNSWSSGPSFFQADSFRKLNLLIGLPVARSASWRTGVAWCSLNLLIGASCSEWWLLRDGSPCPASASWLTWAWPAWAGRSLFALRGDGLGSSALEFLHSLACGFKSCSRWYRHLSRGTFLRTLLPYDKTRQPVDSSSKILVQRPDCDRQ